MNRFVLLILTVVAVAALIGAAIGWQFPFLGGKRSQNLSTAQQGSQSSSANRPKNQSLGANQPTKSQTQNSTTAQAPADTVDPEASNTSNQSGQGTSDASAPAAMW